MHDARPPRDSLWSPQHRSLTIGLVLTITLVAFEALAVSTVMPIVLHELGDLPLYGWVFSAFFLGSLIGIVLIGGSVDRFGLVRPFALALGLFAIGLLAGGSAPSMPFLVAARFVQGLGGGAISPIAYVAIGRSLPERLRPVMFATLSTAWVLPGVIGPAIAGAVGEQLGWRVVFLGLLPLIAISGSMTLVPLRNVAPATTPSTPMANRGRLLPNAILVAGGTMLVTAALTSASLLPGIPLAVAGLALGIPAFRRLTPPGTLRVATGLPSAIFLRGVLTFGFFCADAYVPYALQHWRGTSASVAGIALTAATLSWTAGAWFQSRRIERWGPRRLVRLGFATLVLGLVAFGTVLVPAVPLPFGIAAWAVAGLGMGFSYSPLSLTTLAEAVPGSEGSATSALQLSDTVGTAMGTGVGGALVAAGAAAGLPDSAGLGAAFAVGVVAALGGLLLVGRLPRLLRQRRTADGELGAAATRAAAAEP